MRCSVFGILWLGSRAKPYEEAYLSPYEHKEATDLDTSRSEEFDGIIHCSRRELFLSQSSVQDLGGKGGGGGYHIHIVYICRVNSPTQVLDVGSSQLSEGMHVPL